MEVQGMKALLRARFVLPVIILCAFVAESAAQQLALSGTVRDNAGVIPGATVVLTSGGSQVATATTDEGGSYRFPGLMAGSFELTFSMRGFETISRTVTLTSETPAIVMSVGRVSTTLTVTASGGKATATRLPVANDDVPAQVSSIPQELIRQQGFNTVGEALQNASGVQAVRWYGAYEQYTIRGFSDPDRDSFNVVLLDGMRMGGNRSSRSISRRRARSHRSTRCRQTVHNSIPAPRVTTRWVIAGRDGTAAWTRASPCITSPATT
jgi:hypothetical protein